MIKLDDLWIGDELKIISSGRIGTFEGKHANGKAIIRSEENTYLAEAADLEMYYAPKPKKELNFSEAPKAKTQGVGDSIDLHIEVLNPNMQGSRAERILDVQVNAFEEFLAAAKQANKLEVTIIHGKGAGVLKGCVMTIIKTDKDIKQYHEVHDGGAVRIVL